MTNILKIPLLNGAQTTFTLTTNSQWNDTISFSQSGFPAPFSIASCGLVSSSNVVTCQTTALIVPGLTVSDGASLPIPAVSPYLVYVLSITSQTTFTLGDANGNPVNAVATNPAAILTFSAPPLNLAGIGFISSIAQASVSSARILLTAQTQDNTIINNVTAGTIQYNVSQAKMAQLLPGNYSLDIIAYDGTYVINLFPQGPASVIVSAGISTTAFTAGATVLPSPIP